MSQKIPTKIPFIKVVQICFFAVFRPSRLIELEKENVAEIENSPVDNEPRVKKVHNAFWASFILIILFSVIGSAIGLLLKCFYGAPSSLAVNTLQIIGAGLLLWGTLFVRGFEIESYCCVTLGERVNQWLYRTLYCIGTAVIISSLVWGLK